MLRLSPYIIMSAIAAGLFAVAACGGDKYGDAKKLMNDQIDAVEAFAGDMEDAESAEDAAAAINAYALRMKALHPRLKIISDKYPGLMSGGNPPDELRAEMEKMVEAGKRLQAAMTKNMKYMMNQDVREAMSNMVRTEK